MTYIDNSGPHVRRVAAAELRPDVQRARDRFRAKLDECLRAHAYMVRMEIALELAEKREVKDG